MSPREVASGITNLGNTCYINCILQALAHAPELLNAIDISHHKRSCTTCSSSSTTTTTTPTYCTLCELEKHILNVHKSPPGSPVAPSDFINGFMSHVAPQLKLGVQEDSHEFLRLLIESMQKASEEEEEYPYQLFRGCVSSTVTCESCSFVSSKIDPMEDIGLEVLPVSRGDDRAEFSDVNSSLEKFTRVEHLDSNYKCDKCGVIGKATKQTKLSSIPPILTLHLKRFRYGGVNTFSTGRSSSRSNGSGSAKIEGHINFAHILDLRPYLTKELRDKEKSMICRLFAVICHTGKNSHSGHYIAYVRNLAKNEWWKMDDARVVKVNLGEVSRAEAYMLFYRVVDHPVGKKFALKLKEEQEKKRIDFEKEEQRQKEEVVKKKKEEEERQKKSVEKEQQLSVDTTSKPKLEQGIKSSNEKENDVGNWNKSKKRRLPPEFSTGKDWLLKKTKTSAHLFLPLINRAQEFLSETIEFNSGYFQLIMTEAKDGRIGKGPSGVCNDDVQGGVKKIKHAILNLFYELMKGKENHYLAAATTHEKNDDKDDKKGTGEKMDDDILGASILDRKSDDANNIPLIPVVKASEALI